MEEALRWTMHKNNLSDSPYYDSVFNFIVTTNNRQVHESTSAAEISTQLIDFHTRRF